MPKVIKTHTSSTSSSHTAPTETKAAAGSHDSRTHSTFRKIIGLMYPYAPQIAGILLLAVIVVLSTLLVPVFSGDAVDAAIGIGNVDFSALATALLRMAGAVIVTTLAQWLLTRLSNHVVYGMLFDLRMRAFAKLQCLPLSYIDSHSHGDISSRVVNDVEQFANGMIMAFQQFFTGFLTIVLTLVFMFLLKWQIALLVVGITPLSVILAQVLSRKAFVHFSDQSERRGNVTGIASEMIQGISSVQAFGMQEISSAQFNEADELLRQSSFKAVFYSALSNPSTRFINNLIYGGVGVYGAFIALAGGMTVGSLTAFLGYANQYTKPFNDISGVITELQNSFACAERLFELFGEDELVPDVPQALVFDQAKGTINIQNIDFSYVPGKPILSGLSLDIAPGERVAVVGPTGFGKTTLINLLMRFYDIDSGHILFDGLDIQKISRASLRSQIGMVLQDTWIQHATVRENISMARPNATLDEVKEAAKLAHAHRFIEKLPQGYDTMLGTESISLSAGQQQLLCIARVFLAQPRILILDEATSNIDTRTELQVQQAFDRLMEGKTSLVVAHRLSTIQGADKIVVMGKGHIVEMGTHEELLAQNGFYAQIYNAQFDTTE